MPAVPSSPRVKLRSTSRRVPRARSSEAALAPETDSEPTMRLSRAILVMLLLHVVAVGGFIASSRIREHDLRRHSGDVSTPVEADDSLSPLKAADATRAKAVDAVPARPSVHVVRQGETLMRIANENGVTLAALVAANGAETVTAPLRAGQELKLPDKSPDPGTQVADGTASALSLIEGRPGSPNKISSPAPGGPSKTTPSTPDSGKVYAVGKGESIYTIAQKLKVTPESLLRLNQIDDPKKLKPGQKLRVPVSSLPKAKGK